MLNDSDDHNILIQAGENANIKEFRAHTNILRARSPYFKTALSAKWVTKKNNMFEFKKPNVNPVVFDMILNRDGMNAINNYSSGQRSVLVLVKDQSSKIYGGYSPIGLNVSGSYGTWQYTSDSFIFSCENGDFKNVKISRVTNYSYAIYDNYNNGFNFGSTFYMSGQNVYLQYQGYYDANAINSNTNTNFVPKEIELFNVISS
ncbi:1345_t:CDS:2 [Funneliformis mosseae]|uniref:1345_t:CDS:1 n=1 Tax=Funneliformis mosseae TaxID=27381 RepID=A0A9N9DFQ1_FUNMO|nr:1345_t:CDS:2 [Funneliformis mosseae]